MSAAPTGEYLAAFTAPTTRVTRRVDIYESDGETIWREDVPIVGGSVSVDQGRAERRTVDLVLDNSDGSLKSYPGGFWYDKILKVYRGIEAPAGLWETQLGEFMIDDLSQPNFPPHVSVRGRDYTKKLLLDKFPAATQFAAGNSIETVIKAIALNGGITKFIFPTSTGKSLGVEHLFERGTERWKAMDDIATAFGYELYFDTDGYLVMGEHQDPLTSPVVFTFKTGEPDGNLARYTKSVNDTQIKNHVVVSGENANQVPVFAEVENTEPDSPTNIASIGRRTWEYPSAYIDNYAQALSVARDFLKVMALESFEISMDSLVIPWLDAGKVVEFIDPDPAPGDPTRFLLSSFTIPLSLGTMSGTARRISMVG